MKDWNPIIHSNPKTGFRRKSVTWKIERANYMRMKFKWNERAMVKFPKTFFNNYPVAQLKLITPENFETF